MSHPLDTAVILAGGQGMRTRPLTDSVAKPMISVAGLPFLERLILQLREQGIQRFVILLGYLPQTVTEYFGDGGRWNVSIEYSSTAVENNTGKRLHVARDLIPEHFLLLYCDNYWPANLGVMWERFCSSNLEAQITVYSNTDGYTKNNLRLDHDKRVLVYDKSRTARGLHGVDIGYAILKKRCLDLLSGENESFEEIVYVELAMQSKLGAFLTHHRYYSIGSLERVKQAGEFFSQQPTVILDRDGVLNEKASRGEYITHWDQFRWLPGAKEALKLLHSAGYRVIVITNQAGIARGKMSTEDLESIHCRMLHEVRCSGGEVEKIYHCPHHWEEGCFCRKPSPGMLFQSQKDYDLDLSKVILVGDDDRDIQAATVAGCPSYLLQSGERLDDVLRRILICRTEPQALLC